jgi:hypothetical protein
MNSLSCAAHQTCNLLMALARRIGWELMSAFGRPERQLYNVCFSAALGVQADIS